MSPSALVYHVENIVWTVTMNTMKSWQYTSARGGLEHAMQLEEIPFPSALTRKPGFELVRIESMALNPGDYKLAEGEAWLGKIMSKWMIPKPASPGLDFAGTISGGPKDGQRVFGRMDWPYQNGALAQYALVKEDGTAESPEGVSFDQGAALGTAVISAYLTLAPYVKKGDRVFINGGSGGVGTFAVQIAKLLGCFVVTSCSTRNVELCNRLGADEVIDYMQVERKDIGSELIKRVESGKIERFDLVVENVGNDIHLHRKSARFTHNTGKFILLAAMDETFAQLWSMFESWARPRWLGGVPLDWKFVLAYNDSKALEQIRQWVADGKLEVILDEVFDFRDAPKAVVKLKTGRARGRIVVSNIAD